MVVDNFQEANKCPEIEIVCSTLEVDKVITPFTQRQQGLTTLLDNALDSKVGGIYYENTHSALRCPRTGPPIEEEVAIE